MFSRKQYEHLAARVRELPRDKRVIIALFLADVFERDNPRFDRSKFTKACEV